MVQEMGDDTGDGRWYRRWEMVQEMGDGTGDGRCYRKAWSS